MSTRSESSHASPPRRHRARRASEGRVDQDPEVQQITDAVVPLEVDQARRMKRYLVEMGLRIVCFIAAFVVYEFYPNKILLLSLLVVAAVLPYIAVIGVNAGRERGDGEGSFVSPTHTVLDGPTTREADEDETTDGPYDEGTVIEGSPPLKPRPSSTPSWERRP